MKILEHLFHRSTGYCDCTEPESLPGVAVGLLLAVLLARSAGKKKKEEQTAAFRQSNITAFFWMHRIG